MNDAFFKIFKHRVTGSLSASSGHKKGHLLFKEQVDLLQKTEQFIQEIREGLWDENQLRELFVEPVDLKGMAKICTTLNGFRFQAGLINNPILERNSNFKSLLKIYRELDLELRIELERNIRSEIPLNVQLNSFHKQKLEIEFNKKAFVYSHVSDQSPSWGIENFPLERVIRLISIIRNQSQDWLNETLEVINSTRRKIYRETRQLNALLGEHTNLYVLVVDIRFVNYLHKHNLVQEQDFWHGCTPFVHGARVLLKTLSGSVYGYSQVESDLRSGLNLHCILYFKHNPKFNERKIVKELEAKLLIQFPDLQNIEIRNWNNVIRKHYSSQAVGHIKNNNIEQVEAVEQWVLNYYLKINDYLWTSFQVQYEIAVKDHFRQITVDAKAAKIAYENMQKHIKKNEMPMLEIDEKSTWSTRHLSKSAKERINLSNHYYRALDEASSKSLNYLEIFIETLLDSSFYAFDLRQDQSDISELTVPALEKALTRIGRQFISLSKHYVHPKDSLLYHQLFSEKINFQLVHNFKQSIATKSVTLKHLVDLSDHIAKLRNFLNLPLTQLAGQSIATYRLNQYKLYQDRIDTTNQYLKPLLKNDVKAFHVKFQLVFKHKKTRQSEFSELFTKFLHQAKRARPLYWMSGYWGFWRENQDATPYAEIIFFLDNNAFHIRDDPILKLLKAEWESCLDKHCKPAMLMLVPEKIIRRKLEITHVFSERWRSWSASVETAKNWSVLIESVNKERQKKLLTEIVRDFIVDCTFQEKPNNNIPKVLIKGNKPRKKQKVSKKDSSSTDEPQDT